MISNKKVIFNSEFCTILNVRALAPLGFHYDLYAKWNVKLLHVSLPSVLRDNIIPFQGIDQTIVSPNTTKIL